MTGVDSHDGPGLCAVVRNGNTATTGQWLHRDLRPPAPQEQFTASAGPGSPCQLTRGQLQGQYCWLLDRLKHFVVNVGQFMRQSCLIYDCDVLSSARLLSLRVQVSTISFEWSSLDLLLWMISFWDFFIVQLQAQGTRWAWVLQSPCPWENSQL